MAVRIKALLGLTAAGLCASVLVPAAAQAQTATFTFCNLSSAPEYVAFPYRGWYASTIQNPGHCWQHTLAGQANDEAVGYRLINGAWPAVATKYFSDSGSPQFFF